jgi:hypothetical protein
MKIFAAAILLLLALSEIQLSSPGGPPLPPKKTDDVSDAKTKRAQRIISINEAMKERGDAIEILKTLQNDSRATADEFEIVSRKVHVHGILAQTLMKAAWADGGLHKLKPEVRKFLFQTLADPTPASSYLHQLELIELEQLYEVTRNRIVIRNFPPPAAPR